MRVLAALLIGLLTVPAASATAQFGAAKTAAQRAADQSNAHTDAMQRPTAASQAPATKSVTTAGKAASAAAGTATKTAQQRTPGLTVAPETAPASRTPVIMREVFAYDPAGRRDPFVSLLTTDELRPSVADLRLVGVLYDESGRRPVAILRDLLAPFTQYRVTTGMTLGRMRVAAIKRRSVVFSIEEFGTNRQDSLVLGDTTKVRAR